LSIFYLWCLEIAQSTWTDADGYWDNICYPEYIRAHKDLFKDGDVESGAPREDLVNGLLLIEPEVKENKNKMDMLDIVEVCLEKIRSYSALESDRVRDIDFSV
jgi:nicotinamide/nicotinate riboside kinase